MKKAIFSFLFFCGLTYSTSYFYNYEPILWYVGQKVKGESTSCSAMPESVWMVVDKCLEMKNKIVSCAKKTVPTEIKACAESSGLDLASMSNEQKDVLCLFTATYEDVSECRSLMGFIQ